MENEFKKIFLVDDDIVNLTVAKNALIDKYDVFTIPTCEKLFHILEKITPDLILLDVMMPDMSGYDVIKALKRSESTSAIPVIFLTGLIDPENEIRGLNLGAVDYLTKPFSGQLLLKRIEMHLRIEAQKKESENYSNSLEQIVIDKTETIFVLQNAILKTVVELVECRDNVTGGHIERTQKYLQLLIDIMRQHNIYTNELETWDINLFIMSSQLHDVGKIAIRDDILMKPAILTREEFEEMKKHTLAGVEIIEKIEKNTGKNDFLQYSKIFAGSHHEKWNGTGYPFGLKGTEIPLQGRLMAIVDVYDALTHDRPYKKAFTHAEAMRIIGDGVEAHFDPRLTEVFFRHEKEFRNIALAGNHFSAA